MLFPLLIPLMAFLLCVQRKALLHMRLKLRNLTTQIRETLLEMPDRVFMKTMLDWITLAEEHLQYPDWSDEYRYALGFRVQSQETQTIYATFSLLHENEPNTVNVLWIEPGMTTLRNILKNFTLEQFYRTVIPLASDALFDRAAQERWGPPPSSLNNGYEFPGEFASPSRGKSLSPNRAISPISIPGERTSSPPPKCTTGCRKSFCSW